jgi:hypothetical protein
MRQLPERKVDGQLTPAVMQVEFWLVDDWVRFDMNVRQESKCARRGYCSGEENMVRQLVTGFNFVRPIAMLAESPSIRFLRAIACLLGLNMAMTANSFGFQEPSQTPTSSQYSKIEEIGKTKRLFAADSRLEITMPTHPVELAQPIDIPIELTQSDVVILTTKQHSASAEFHNQRGGEEMDAEGAKIISDDGFSKVVEITPLQIGKLLIDVDAVFADGGVSRKTYELTVVPCSKGLKSFYINHGEGVLALVLEDKPTDRQLWLSPEVYYDQLDYPIYLQDSRQIKFAIEQSESTPVIQLDENGMIHALNPGSAKVSAEFAGKVDSVVINVYTKESAPSAYRRIPGNRGDENR